MNFLLVLIAAVLNMLLGYVWYSALFSKAWTQATGISKDEMEKAKKKGMGKNYFLMFAASLVLSGVLQELVFILNIHDFASGMKLGFFIWLGFTGTALFSQWLFSGKPKKLLLIDTGYYLVAYSLIGGFLSVWTG